jgi:hypothetical protein
VKSSEFLNKDKKSHLLEVTKCLIQDTFFATAKVPELADRAGAIFSPVN